MTIDPTPDCRRNDDLIIELKRLGGMEEALEAMRKVRRVVVRSHGG